MLQVHNEGFFDNAIYDNDDESSGDENGVEDYFGKYLSKPL